MSDLKTGVAVVVPAKNEEQTIGEIVESVKPFGETVWVVDGHSRDRTAEIARKAGAQVITRAQCMDGIAEMIHDIQVEATFPDGTKLVTVHEPIR